MTHSYAISRINILLFLYSDGKGIPSGCVDANNPSAPSVSSLVLTLCADPTTRAQALDALRARTDVELGPASGAWIPAVLESNDPRGAIEALQALPGIEFVDVVFVEVSAPPSALH